MISRQINTDLDVLLEQEEYPELTCLELAEYSSTLAEALTFPPPPLRDGGLESVHAA